MKNLRKIRRQKGYTCEKLGKMINVQKSAMSKYERDEIQPGKDILLRLSDIFDCSIDYLLDKTDDPTPPNSRDKKIEGVVMGFDGEGQTPISINADEYYEIVAYVEARRKITEARQKKGLDF